MPVDQRPARQLREREYVSFGPLFEKLAEQKNLLRESERAFVFREKVDKFVAEDGGATRFEDDDRCRRFDFRVKLVYDLAQQALGAIERADIKERAPATQVSARNDNVEPAASSTSTAALAVAGRKWLLKVSAQSSTEPLPYSAHVGGRASSPVLRREAP